MNSPNRLIRVRLRGGLGNQLSCFYAGLYLSKFNGGKLLLDEARKHFPELIKGATEIYSEKDFSTVESFCLMANSNQIITANSSYSTWAAQFVEMRGGRVICPERMFTYETKDLRPPNWIRVS